MAARSESELHGVTVGVVGAGMMGSALAYTCARAGADVTLVARTGEKARAALGYAQRREDRAREHGASDEELTRSRLGRIRPTADVGDLASAQLVVEAVAESVATKQQVLRAVERVLGPDAVLASTTSTLPVTTLGAALERPERFLGMHFFSPVDRMALVEMIVGAKTSDATLETALALARLMGKSPVVVRDVRGFFTSRVMERRLDEALIALGDGVPPELIERAAEEAGYPVPTLRLLDEISLALNREVQQEHRNHVESSGGRWEGAAADRVRDRMLDVHHRAGRVAGGGFYDYDDDGARRGLWPGLGDEFGPRREIPIADIRDRLLFSEVLEALRCVSEGVVGSEADADTGSLLGIGFPRDSGGVISFARGFVGGPAGFLSRAHELSRRYGQRFAPTPEIVGVLGVGN